MKQITDSIIIKVGLFNDLTGLDIDGKKLSMIAKEIGTDVSKNGEPKYEINLTQLMGRYKLVAEKVDEVIKSVNRGEMEKRILADQECVLKKKPVGWAAFTANFIPDINSLLSKLEAKHQQLKDTGYIISKQNKPTYKLR